MPIFKCTKCHHEWESSRKPIDPPPICSWCYQDDGSVVVGYIIQERTALEQMLYDGSWREIIARRLRFYKP